jgi:hypothetical protein
LICYLLLLIEELKLILLHIREEMSIQNVHFFGDLRSRSLSKEAIALMEDNYRKLVEEFPDLPRN